MTTMTPLKARVKNGRLVLDEPTDLPEGDVLDLVPLDGTDSDSTPLPMSADEDVQLESPPFSPPELSALAGRGFLRQNRWLLTERRR